MGKDRKYNYRAIQDEDSGTWIAEITRRVTSRKTVVTKSHSGFATESEALAWGEEEIKSFVKHLIQQNAIRSEEREEKAEKTRHWLENRDRRRATRTDKLWKK